MDPGLFALRVAKRRVAGLRDGLTVGVDLRSTESDIELGCELVGVLEAFGQVVHLGIGGVLLSQVRFPQTVSSNQADRPLSTDLSKRAAPAFQQ